MAEWTTIATIDAHMDAMNTGTNDGAAAILLMGLTFFGGVKTLWFRAIMNFDLSTFPGAVGDITAAEIVVAKNGVAGVGETIRWIRCVRHSTWVEGEVTWDDASAIQAWTDGGAQHIGNDRNETDEVQSTVPAGSFGTETVTGFKNLAQDAITNRGNILSIITEMDDEADAGDSRSMNWLSTETANQFQKPFLRITYTAAGGGVVEPQVMIY